MVSSTSNSSDPASQISNRFISEKLNEVADLLEQQGANLFRVRAYREASAQVANLPGSVAKVVAQGNHHTLVELPYIGTSIAAAIEELVKTGRLRLIERLQGSLEPEKLFQMIPSIGPKLAEVIHHELGIVTLEGLEAAAHDRRLVSVPGIGPRRTRSIQFALAEILSRRRPRAPRLDAIEPPVELILDVDAEYRRRAVAGDIPQINPRRFNPTGEMRLPILHTERENWRFTALFSNTAQAHRLGRTKDWVVIYFERDREPENQCTVVTERRGTLSGRRVLRGHEEACRIFYSLRCQHPSEVNG